MASPALSQREANLLPYLLLTRKRPRRSQGAEEVREALSLDDPQAGRLIGADIEDEVVPLFNRERLPDIGGDGHLPFAGDASCGLTPYIAHVAYFSTAAYQGRARRFKASLQNRTDAQEMDHRPASGFLLLTLWLEASPLGAQSPIGDPLHTSLSFGTLAGNASGEMTLAWDSQPDDGDDRLPPLRIDESRRSCA